MSLLTSPDRLVTRGHTVTGVPVNTGSLVTMHVWRVPARHIPATITSVATDSARARRYDGAAFVKVLGTARQFSLRSADPTRWVLLVSWETPKAAKAFADSSLVERWQRRSLESWTATLRPLASRGRWSRRMPWTTSPDRSWSGPVVVLTRARLRTSRLTTFWRAVSPVAADVRNRHGLRAAFGIGEAPIGVQGTFSLWDNERAMRSFAYEGTAHRHVIDETVRVGWYSEELFAHFAVLEANGTLDGKDPLVGGPVSVVDQ